MSPRRIGSRESIADGEWFATVFERQCDLSLADIEANDYQLMEAYLAGQPSPTPLRHQSLASDHPSDGEVTPCAECWCWGG